MIEQSKLYSFLDDTKRFNIQFLEGQKLIHDLSLLQPLNSSTFSFLRNTVLSLLPMNMFQKNMETLGFYIDSEKPFFRFKLEMSFQGTFRTLLIPHDITEIPNVLSGHVRLIKTSTSTTPYTSILEITKQTSKQITDHIINQTYQINGTLLLSESVDQSILVMKLPTEQVDSNIDNSASLQDFINSNLASINKILETSFNSEQDILTTFHQNKLTYLQGRDIRFFCPCSKDQMINNIRKLSLNDTEHVFSEPGPISLTCDYCRKNYSITKEEVEKNKDQ